MKKIIILTVLVIVFMSCGFFDITNYITKEVEYRVFNTAIPGLVDIVINKSNELNFNFAVTPWVYSHEINKREYSNVNLYLWAQNHHDYGSIMVEIYIDDVLYKSSTVSGAYVTTEIYGNVIW